MIVVAFCVKRLDIGGSPVQILVILVRYDPPCPANRA